jgi:D-alanine-D-alanine ligase
VYTNSVQKNERYTLNNMAIFDNKLTVAVLMGGIGGERDVSLQSGQCVAESLKEAGFKVVTADVAPDRLDILDQDGIDIFFPALHGEFGEDGGLQQILEDKSLLYAGSGPAASRAAFDKMVSKKFFAAAGAAVPPAIEFNGLTDANQVVAKLPASTSKYVVKPMRQGSSIGVSIVTTAQQAVEVAAETQRKYGDCMIEEFIKGRELTVGILCDRTLPIIEIRPKRSFYSYQAKYLDDETEFLFDTITDASITARISRAALDCFRSLGCRHFSRVDFILTEDGIPYALEINTIPGFTTHSLLPKAAAREGITMNNLCRTIVDTAYLSPVEQQD